MGIAVRVLLVPIIAISYRVACYGSFVAGWLGATAPLEVRNNHVPGRSSYSKSKANESHCCCLASILSLTPHPPVKDADTQGRAHQALGDMCVGHVVHGGRCASNKSALAGNNNCSGTCAQYNDNTSTTSAAVACNTGAVSRSQKVPACDCVWRGRRRYAPACAPRALNPTPPTAARR